MNGWASYSVCDGRRDDLFGYLRNDVSREERAFHDLFCLE